MKKIETLKWNFLCELQKLSEENEDSPFVVSLASSANEPKNFKCDIVDKLYRNGAIEILDEDFGTQLNKHGVLVNLAKGANLRIFNRRPIEMTVKLKTDAFNRFYNDQQDIIRTKGKTLVSCTYKGYRGTLLNINNKPIKFKTMVGLILYYIYQARKADNLQDFKTYNTFVKEEHPNTELYASSVLFSQAVEDINKIANKKGGGYVNSVIDIIRNGNKRNTYKWNPKLIKK